MHVVVVGATGNIGTNVIGALADDDRVERIDAVARREPNWHPPKTNFVRADVRTDNLVEVFRGSDAVVQLAWAFQPTHDPVETWQTNVEGSIRAFEAAAAAGVSSLVYASSVAAYSPGPGRLVDEKWPTSSLPTAAYGREKSYVERYLDAFQLRHDDIRVTRIRPSFVLSRQSSSEQRRLFAGRLFPRSLARPRRLPVLPLPDGFSFQCVHGDDLGELFRLVITGDAAGPFNVAAEPVIDHLVLGEMFGARPWLLPHGLVTTALGVAWRLRLVPSDDGLLRLLLSLPSLDTTRARVELGWQPRHTAIETLREMLNGMADGAGMATQSLDSSGDRRP